MLEKYYKQALEDAVSSLKDNGVIIVPTDTVYGLACLSSSKEGKERIYLAKGRDNSKQLPIIVNSFKMLKSVISVDFAIIEKLKKYFPGPITIVGNRNPEFNNLDSDTIAVRMIEVPIVNKIIEMVNEPLCLTSANLSNEKESNDISELLETFDGYVDCAFIGKNMKNEPSTIIKISDDGSVSLIREGKIPFKNILEVLKND